MRRGSPEFAEALERFAALRRATFYPKTDLPCDAAGLRAALHERETQARAMTEAVPEIFRSLLGCEPVEIQPVAGGTFHCLLRVRVPGPETFYLRAEYVFRERPAFEFLVEQKLAPLLAARGIPAAEVIEVDLSRHLAPLDFMISRQARGTRLTELEHPETQFIPEAILADFGRLLAATHQIEATGAGLLDPRRLEGDPARIAGSGDDWGDYLRLNLPAHLELCARAGAVSPADVPRLESTFHTGLARIAATPGQTGRLLHGDPGHHNIFVENQAVTALLDWEDALVGDPIFDLAFWGTFVRDPLRDALLRGYRENRFLPADFEFRYWLYYLRIALSKTAHRHLFGYTDRPGRAPAAGRIAKALANLAKC